MNRGSVPSTLSATRDALHQIAFFALAPARYRAEGRMGLKPTSLGFGTPRFEGRVLRVEEDLLVEESDAGVATRTITTIREATAFCGLDYRTDWFPGFKDPLAPADPDAPLPVDPAATVFIAEWFQRGNEVLSRLGTRVGPAANVSEIQLWPEHFDLAIEIGEEREGRRASYGASPGDHAHPQPYIYVSAWGEIDRSNPYWNDHHFNGASLGYREVMATADPAETSLRFMLAGYRVLHPG